MIRFPTLLRLAALTSGLAVLAACQPAIPDSGAVITTIQSPTAQAQRDAALTQNPVSIPAPQPVTAAPLDPATRPLPGSVTAAVNGDAAARNSGVPPVQASPSNPAPALVNSAGISSEQDFGAVSTQRSIEADAERIAANRAQYTQVTPTALPSRTGSAQPNIVQYALNTSNPVGSRAYPRSGLNTRARTLRNCGKYASADLAQIDFLSTGGPQRDRKGLDPDGDGYACSWDPTPFRNVHTAPASN